MTGAVGAVALETLGFRELWGVGVLRECPDTVEAVNDRKVHAHPHFGPRGKAMQAWDLVSRLKGCRSRRQDCEALGFGIRVG